MIMVKHSGSCVHDVDVGHAQSIIILSMGRCLAIHTRASCVTGASLSEAAANYCALFSSVAVVSTGVLPPTRYPQLDIHLEIELARAG
jgi:hypothetical protein